MVTRRNRGDRGVKRYAAVVFVCGILLTLLILHLVMIGQQQNQQTNLQFFVERQIESIGTEINNDISFIGAGASFFQATTPPAWTHFSTFAQPLIFNSKSLIAMQWMKKVYPEQIDDYVIKMRQRFPSFSLKTMLKPGEMLPGFRGDEDSEIFIISDTYPINNANIQTLGFYPTLPAITSLIKQAETTQTPTLSKQLTLLQDWGSESHRYGFLVFYPVFEPGSQVLQGVVIGAIRSAVYFENMVTLTSWGQHVGVRVVSESMLEEGEATVYQNRDWQTNQGTVISVPFELYNLRWIVQFKQDATMSDTDLLLLICIGFSGVVISLLLAYVVQLMLREQYRLAMLVNRRTRDLQYLVDRDPLTEVYNRRAFNRLAEYQVERSQCFSLIIIDIDRFKHINDKYGHVTGDNILRQVAAQIRSYVSDKDTLFRLGGDEFAIISKRSDYLSLDNYLTTLCREVASMQWPEIGDDFTCTLSIGAAMYRGEPLEQLLNRADEQLYFSKDSGRNCASIV